MSDKYKHIDDLFRDKFKDFELDPPEHVWGNIKTQMHGSGNGGNITNGGIYGITIILILSSILTWYLLSSSNNDGHQVPNSNITQLDDNDYKSSTRNIAINQNRENETIEGHSTKVIDSSLKNKKKQKPRFDISEPAKVPQGKTNLAIQEDIQTNYSPPIDKEEITDDFESSGLLSAGVDTELLAIHDTFQSDIEDTEAPPTNKTANETNTQDSGQESKNSENVTGLVTVSDIKSDYGQKGKWMFGLFFTPEMIFYPDNNNLNNRSYALDVNAIYKFSGYFLQSGLGVSWTSDEGNCAIDYNKYMGSYEDVYNVTYDSIGNELIPVYHTETVKVYDSIDHVTVMPTKNHYTYLQIPILFGYGNENRRFGWFVKGGPSLSIMVSKDIATNNLSETEDKILHIENEIPSRISTNWQFVFSGGISYRLSNHLSFTAEPLFRYYLNSTYEKNKLNLKNPYSIGLRVGFIVDL